MLFRKRITCSALKVLILSGWSAWKRRRRRGVKVGAAKQAPAPPLCIYHTCWVIYQYTIYRLWIGRPARPRLGGLEACQA